MIIYFVRHGETDWNVQSRMAGRHDVPLNSKGIELARQTGMTTGKIRFDAVFSSPLTRARDTARLVTAVPDLKMTTDGRLAESDWGIWCGMTREQVAALGQEANLLKVYNDPLNMEAPEGGEAVTDVIKRGRSFYDSLTGNPEYMNKTVLVSTHGCAIRAITNHLFENPSDFWQGRVPPNCSFTIVSFDGNKSRVEAVDRIYYDPSQDINYYKL